MIRHNAYLLSTNVTHQKSALINKCLLKLITDRKEAMGKKTKKKNYLQYKIVKYTRRKPS